MLAVIMDAPSQRGRVLVDAYNLLLLRSGTVLGYYTVVWV